MKKLMFFLFAVVLFSGCGIIRAITYENSDTEKPNDLKQDHSAPNLAAIDANEQLMNADFPIQYYCINRDVCE